MPFSPTYPTTLAFVAAAFALLAYGSFAQAQSFITRQPEVCPWERTADGRCPSAREHLDTTACIGAIDGISYARRNGSAEQVVEARSKARQLGCLSGQR